MSQLAMKPLAIVVAVSANGVIGKDGKLPWHIPQDLKRFRDLTKDHAIIMGRKTYASIGRPLPNRTNIVVSSTMAPVDGLHVVATLDEAIRMARLIDDEPRIIGGARLYEEALPLTTVVYLSSVSQTITGDDVVRYPKSAIEWTLKEAPKPGPGVMWMTLVRKPSSNLRHDSLYAVRGHAS